MKQYLIRPVTTGFFSGSLNEKKLQDFLNQHAAQGWRFVRSIHETKKVFGLFSREAHFVIFERDALPPGLAGGSDQENAELLRGILHHLQNDPTPRLLRQLLKAYQVTPEA